MVRSGRTIKPNWNRLKPSVNWLPLFKGSSGPVDNLSECYEMKTGVGSTKIGAVVNLWLWQKYVATDCRLPGNFCRQTFWPTTASHVWWYATHYSQDQDIFGYFATLATLDGGRMHNAHGGVWIETRPLCFISSKGKKRQERAKSNPEWKSGFANLETSRSLTLSLQLDCKHCIN